MKSISANVNIMIKAAERASKVLIRDFGEVENLQVSVKGPSDFVSNADTKAEKIIIEELSKSRKNFSIISEETGIIEKSDKKNLWVVDPIDGTNNFLHGVPHFAISIAHKYENEIISGIIFDPIKNEIFFAEKNNGSYFNNQRIRVSKKKNIKDCLFATGGERKIYKDLKTRETGSAALDLAYVAAGRFDGYFQKNLNLWDIAAGIILVNESGGKISNVDMSVIENIKITAASNSINEKMLEKLNNF